MKIPTQQDLAAIDPKIRMGQMELDRPEEAFPSVMQEPHASYGVPDNGHLRTHSPYDGYVQVVTKTSVPEPDIEQRLPNPVSYTLRDRMNNLIWPGGRASVRARQPKGMVYDIEYAEDVNPLGNEHFSGGKVGITPHVAIAQYQYVPWWEEPHRIERVEPQLFSDQIPPAMLRQG